ncbi:hypothetical protein TWF106_006548 [Orbilia oligospora]|uniref:G domain-containing protein n=1 Tax=Orbilia oligospora TaxID=2813651 RepID=A0A7C8QR43_ORBOL|nr:hypothetical protein TWF106_006548 [Orbilia oligospora]
MAYSYRDRTYTESSPSGTTHAPHNKVEHEGDTPGISTGSRAATSSSQNESITRNSASIENWSSDITTLNTEDQKRPKTVIKRKPVSSTRPPETESCGSYSRKRTETMDSSRSFSENFRAQPAELDGRSENTSLRRSSASEVKQVQISHSERSESLIESGLALLNRQYWTPFKIFMLAGLILTLPGILSVISSSGTGPTTGLTPASPIVAIMGETGAGKSSFIKALGGRDDSGNFPLVGHTLNSTTKKVQWYSAVAGSKGFYILDTPGFDDSYMSDFDILEGLTKELAMIYSNSRPLTGIIYVHDVSKEKMGGTSHKSLRTFQKLVGERSMENVVLVTTHWRSFLKGDQVKREDELRKTFWASMIGRGSKILRHDGSTKSAVRIVKEMLDRKPVVVKIVDEMVNQKMAFYQTDAGGVVQEGLKVLEGKLDSNVAALNDEITQLKKERKDAENAVEDRVKKLEKQWKTSTQKERQEIEAQMKQIKTEGAEQAGKFNKQLTTLVYEKQQQAYQINDLKKANEALRSQLDQQRRRQLLEEEERRKKEKEDDESGFFTKLFTGIISAIIWVFLILVLIGFCVGSSS